MSHFHNLTIKDITRETDKSVVISFQVPDHLKSTYAFKAGQYVTLKTTINNHEVRRDYSLCSSPKSDVLFLNLTIPKPKTLRFLQLEVVSRQS